MLQISAHPLVGAHSNVYRPWALFRETTVYCHIKFPVVTVTIYIYIYMLMTSSCAFYVELRSLTRVVGPSMISANEGRPHILTYIIIWKDRKRQYLFAGDPQ